MKIEVRHEEDVAVVEMNGRLVSGVGDELLRDEVNRLLGAGQRKILIDLSKISQIDSQGIGELVASYRLARRFSSVLKVVRAGDRVHHILGLAQILPVLSVYESQEDALGAFSREALPSEPDLLATDA